MSFYIAKTRFVVLDSPFTDFSDFFKDLMGPEIFKQYRFCGKKSSFHLMFLYTANTRFVVSDSPYRAFSDFFKNLMSSEIFKQYRFCGNKSSFDLLLHGKGTFCRIGLTFHRLLRFL